MFLLSVFNLFLQTACFNSTTIYVKSQNILYSTYLDVTVLKLRELSPILVGSEDTLLNKWNSFFQRQGIHICRNWTVKTL